MNDEAARVFISCGQRVGEEDSHPIKERDLAHRVKKMLEKELGFEACVATYEQTLLSLRENIFDRLSNQTEYFLFIDFCRETIEGSVGNRGSLFSHQELAIASFLNLDNDILIFPEEGVSKQDGMIGAFQANAQLNSFSDRADLVERIQKKVRENWRNDWRRKLVLDQPDDPDCEAVPQCVNSPDQTLTGFFFHIKVRNRHIRTTARDCYAYLRSITDRSGQRRPFEAAELKWAGSRFPSAIVPPENCTRRFDAVWFDSDHPQRPNFKVLSDWPRSIPMLDGPGSWELEYEVFSSNVPGSRRKFILDIGADNTVSFGPAHPRVKIAPLANKPAIDQFNEQRGRPPSDS